MVLRGPIRPIYTPSWTASNNRAKASARGSGTSAVGRRRRCWRFARLEVRPVFVLNLRANGGYRRAGIAHSHRLDGDVDAHRARGAVRHPRGDPALGVARADEAIGVVFVAHAPASAVARNVARHFRMIGGEDVRVL